MDINDILNQLVERLKQANPYKIILFGSYAKDIATRDSDIDLMVVLDNDDVAKTFSDRLKKGLYVDKLVRDINYKYAMDIIVYSRKEVELIKNNGNDFIDEIEETGKIIYEKAS